MATYTTNYNLKKPDDADSYDIADANGNMDIIDGALNTLNNQISKYDATSWIGNVTSIDTLNALITPGRYRYYINISGVGLESGWAVVDVAALSGYDNYQQTITFAATGNVYTRMHSTGGTWGGFASLSNQKGIVVVGDVTFSSGTGSKTVNGIKQGARLIAQRRQGSATSIILTAICNTDNTVTFGAYDSSGGGSNFSGTLSGVILAYDNT